jgi:glucokinase
MSYAVGIDLGGSSVKSVAVTAEGIVLARETVEFDAREPLEWAEKVRETALELQQAQGAPAACLGLSAPGLAARDGRSIAHMPGRLEGLENFDWTGFLKHPVPIPVLNDAHAALLGEAWIGAARGCRNVIMLTLGTGVGGAAMVDGHLLQGEISRAGHLGHNCLNPDGPRDATGIPGSLEWAIGNGTVGVRTQGRFATTHDLIRACEQEEELATKYWLLSVQALACSIAGYINMLDPAKVIIGGGIARAGRTLFEPLEKFLRPMEWQPGGHSVPVVPAELGEHAGALGAARRSWDKLAQVGVPLS